MHKFVMSGMFLWSCTGEWCFYLSFVGNKGVTERRSVLSEL